MLDGIRCVDEMRLQSQRVLVRVDLDVPVDDTGAVRDEASLRAILPTLQHVLAAEARLIVAGHRGNPSGKRVGALSVEPVGAKLAELLGCEVLIPDECVGDAARKVIADLRPGQVCLLENLRFEAGEEADDEAFAHRLSRLCDVYINDNFGLARAKHASVHALPRLMPDRGIGFAFRKDYTGLHRLREPERPLVAVIGGTRLEEVREILDLLFPVADAICLGGAVANTFLTAQNCDLKASKVETSQLAHARTILARAKERGVDLLLPSDLVVAKRAGATEGTTVGINALSDGQMALDIGADTVRRFAARMAQGRTVIVWGPLGLFGNPAFADGTLGITRALGRCFGVTAALGPAAVNAVRVAGISERLTLVAPNQDAVLATFMNKRMPAVEVLRGVWD